jgi:hypothetical protein
LKGKCHLGDRENAEEDDCEEEHGEDVRREEEKDWMSPEERCAVAHELGGEYSIIPTGS